MIAIGTGASYGRLFVGTWYTIGCGKDRRVVEVLHYDLRRDVYTFGDVSWLRRRWSAIKSDLRWWWQYKRGLS